MAGMDDVFGRIYANCRSELPPSLKLWRTGARDLSSVLSAIGRAAAEGPAKGDTDGGIACKQAPTSIP
jgi:hypothetical protein